MSKNFSPDQPYYFGKKLTLRFSERLIFDIESSSVFQLKSFTLEAHLADDDGGTDK